MPMHTRDSAGPPRTSYSPRWSHRSEFSWDTYQASCSQMRSFEVMGPQPGPTIPAGVLCRRTGPRAIAKGAFWRLRGPLGPLFPWAPVPQGPPDQIHQSRKFLATSMPVNIFVPLAYTTTLVLTSYDILDLR